MYLRIFTFIILYLTISGIKAQGLPNVDKESIKNDIYFLASDELKGRATGTQENRIAARYIAERFRYLGLESPTGIDDYLQPILFENRKPPKQGKLMITDQTIFHGGEMIILAGEADTLNAPLAFVDQGWKNDTMDQYEGLDVQGKIVVALFGIPGSADPRDGFFSIPEKRKIAADYGALGIIEIYNAAFPWSMMQQFLNREQMMLKEDSEDETDIPYILSNDKLTTTIEKLNNGENVNAILENSGIMEEEIPSPNVVGWLEGNDPDLKDEYVILSAHFDHVGIGRADASGDTIYNGARDNAIGTATILQAAAYFSNKRPKRSLLFIGFTAEEIGLLGSAYYADHPVKPLHKAIFNMNTDGAGYNDVSRISIIGHDRVGVLDIFNTAGEMVGLEIHGDPAPEQGLFDRSDNVSFARKGIPAPDFSPGVTAFDQQLMKYYHQPGDHAEDLDYDYLHKFAQAYIIATEKIANLDQQPIWKEGDKYEKAFNELYNKQ